MAGAYLLKSIMPIFDISNFLHKTDPKLFCILNSKRSKKIDRPIFGWSAGIHLTKMGPKYIGCQFAQLSIPSLNFALGKKLLKNSKLVHFGLIGRHPHLFETARIVGLQIHC